MSKKKALITIITIVIIMALGVGISYKLGVKKAALTTTTAVTPTPTPTPTPVPASVLEPMADPVGHIKMIKHVGGDGSYYEERRLEFGTRKDNPFVDENWRDVRRHYANRGRDLIGGTVTVTGTPIPSGNQVPAKADSQTTGTLPVSIAPGSVIPHQVAPTTATTPTPAPFTGTPPPPR